LQEVLQAAAAAVLGVAAAFLFFLRRVMTKADHAQICSGNGKLIEQKIEVVKAELKGDIKALKTGQDVQQRLLERMDEKLDVIRKNGQRRR
jgi:hypothetical protein